jgi:hypothetical protein
MDGQTNSSMPTAPSVKEPNHTADARKWPALMVDVAFPNRRRGV